MGRVEWLSEEVERTPKVWKMLSRAKDSKMQDSVAKALE